jgi:hypothetical protein
VLLFLNKKYIAAKAPRSIARIVKTNAMGIGK